MSPLHKLFVFYNFAILFLVYLTLSECYTQYRSTLHTLYLATWLSISFGLMELNKKLQLQVILFFGNMLSEAALCFLFVSFNLFRIPLSYTDILYFLQPWSTLFTTVSMAVAIPNLELFISFTGAFCLSTMGIAFPAITQILTFWCHREDTFRFSILLFKNIIIILIAIFAFTIGVTTTVMKFFE